MSEGASIQLELLKEIRENNSLMRQLIEKMEFRQKDWYEPDEVCQLLGIKISKSGNHRRKLKPLRDRGILRTFGQVNPYTYSAAEVQRAADKIRKGQLII